MREPSRISGAPRQGNHRNRHDRLSGRGIRPVGHGVKGLADSTNPLMEKHSPTIRGWTLVVFAATVLVLVFPAVWLVREYGMLPVLAAFFAAVLLAILIAVAPMRERALPALGFRAVGWRPIVGGALVTAVLSVLVSQLGVEPQGMKQAMDIAREPSLFLASLAALA